MNTNEPHIHIIKYRETDGSIKNYFDSPTYQDDIILTEYMFKGMPSYSEEISQDEYALNFQAGDFTIQFSLLQTEISTNGDTIEEFFMSSSGNRNNLFIITIVLEEIGSGGKVIGGNIPVDSIKVNKNPNSDGWFVEVQCIGLEKEFKEWLKRQRITTNWGNGNVTFDNALLNMFTVPSYVFITNQLDMNTRCGFTVYYSDNTIAEYLHDEYPFLMQWHELQDLQKGHGFCWRLVVSPYTTTIGSNIYFLTSFVLFWRSVGLGATANIDVTSHEEVLIDYLETNKNIIIDYCQTYITPGTEQYHNVLLLQPDNYYLPLNRTEPFENNDWLRRNSGDWEYQQDPDYIIHNDDVTVIGLATALQPFLVSGAYGYLISFSRLLHTTPEPVPYFYGFSETVEKTAIPEYKFLLKGIKLGKNVGIRYTATSNLNLFNTITLNGVNFFINKIKNLNPYKKTCDLELIEQ